MATEIVKLYRENEEGYISYQNSYLVYLRKYPFTDNTALCTAITGEDGSYQADLTESNYYKCYVGTTLANLTEEPSWGGTGLGKYISVSGSNQLFTTNGSNLYPTNSNLNLALGTDNANGNKLNVVGNISTTGNLNILGNVSANSLFFTSTTATEISASGSIDLLRSISITATNPNEKPNLIQAFNTTDLTTPAFAVSTGGNTSISGSLVVSSSNTHLVFRNGNNTASISATTNGRLTTKSLSGIYVFNAANNVDNFRMTVGAGVCNIVYDGNGNGISIGSSNGVIPIVRDDGDIGAIGSEFRNARFSGSGYFARALSVTGNTTLLGNITATGSLSAGSVSGSLLTVSNSATVLGSTIRIATNFTPASDDDPIAQQGEIRSDDNYLYRWCNGLWKRIAWQEFG